MKNNVFPDNALISEAVKPATDCTSAVDPVTPCVVCETESPFAGLNAPVPEVS